MLKTRRIEIMTFSDGLIGAIAAAVVGWFVNSVTKVSKAEFKEAIQQAARERQQAIERVDALEKNLYSRMTRTEFDIAFTKVEGLVKDFRMEARSEFKELKSELKTKT